MSDAGANNVPPMLRAYTRRELAEIDRRSALDYGLATIVLMENAGAGLASVVLNAWDAVLDETPDAPELPHVLVACGPGNNGGDGFVAARHLHNEGCAVEVVVLADRACLAEDAAANLDIVDRMGLTLLDAMPADGKEPPDVVIDALLGTGLTRPVEAELAAAIRQIEQHREQGALVVSADLPSGLACDSGEILGACVEADVTASFVGIKRGFLQLTAQQAIGRVEVVPIGAPRDLIERFGEPIEGDVGLWPAEDEPIENEEPSEDDEPDAPSYGARSDRG